MKTYGNNLSYSEWYREVNRQIKAIIAKELDAKGVKAAKRLFNQGYGVDDAVGTLVARR